MEIATGAANAVSSMNNCTPDWFADSQHLIFSYRPANQEGNEYGWTQLWMADAEGKQRTLVYGEDGRHVYGGAVSPDGIYVLFTGNMQEDGDAGGSGAPMALLRLRPESSFQLKADQPTFRISFEPYGIRFWSFERRN